MIVLKHDLTRLGVGQSHVHIDEYRIGGSALLAENDGHRRISQNFSVEEKVTSRVRDDFEPCPSKKFLPYRLRHPLLNSIRGGFVDECRNGNDAALASAQVLIRKPV